MFHGTISKDLARGLKVLRDRIAASEIPASKLDESLTVATWNIREFGNRRRSEAAIHYIAEILGQFDLVGIVELRDNLTDLSRVLKILGPYWRTVYSDVIPDPGGNRERIAYVYDKRAVVFTGLAAEATAPRTKKKGVYSAPLSWWRAPYLVSFRAGNFDFVVISAHICWGTGPVRIKELQLLADWIEEKRQEKNCEDADLIVMGDFNVPSRDDAMFRAITSRGLAIPSALRGLSFGTNLEKGKRYDQILHYPRYSTSFTDAGGVLDFYAGSARPLFPDLSKTEFTFELSDHLPLWMRINTDIDGEVLHQIIRGP